MKTIGTKKVLLFIIMEKKNTDFMNLIVMEL